LPPDVFQRLAAFVAWVTQNRPMHVFGDVRSQQCSSSVRAAAGPFWKLS
jgi:hypothetical protein